MGVSSALEEALRSLTLIQGMGSGLQFPELTWEKMKELDGYSPCFVMYSGPFQLVSSAAKPMTCVIAWAAMM